MSHKWSPQIGDPGSLAVTCDKSRHKPVFSPPAQHKRELARADLRRPDPYPHCPVELPPASRTFEARLCPGATQSRLSAGDPGMDEEVPEWVQALGMVKVAVPMTEAVAGTGLAG